MTDGEAATAAEDIGVGTWRDDPRTGKNDRGAPYEELRVLAARERPFARPVREDFDAARGCVPDGSVDLLHTDGCHTCEAVSNDFSRWRSARSRRGICLLHDSAVRERHRRPSAPGRAAGPPALRRARVAAAGPAAAGVLQCTT